MLAIIWDILTAHDQTLRIVDAPDPDLAMRYDGEKVPLSFNDKQQVDYIRELTSKNVW